MKLLLDTHVLLWFQADHPALPSPIRSAIRSLPGRSYVSIVSLWEIGLKHGIGKLPLRMPLDDFFATITKARFQILPLQPSNIVAASQLPLHHRDPFDRMLIGQAKDEGMSVATVDEQFVKYDVPLIGV